MSEDKFGISETQNLSQEQHPLAVEPKRPNKTKWAVLILIIIAISYVAGYKNGNKGYVFEPKEFKVINQADQPQSVDYSLLWDAIKVVQEKHIDASTTPLDFLYGAVRGAVSAAGDPYTVFFEPKELQTFKTGLAGSFDGIGAEIGKKDGNIVIVAPLDGSPAEKAGLLPQDIIYQVNGASTKDWTVEQAVEKIRGKRGTQVTLGVVREGRSAPFDVTITRETIQIKSVKLEFKQAEKDGQTKNIAIISISQFGDDTKGLFQQAVNEVLSKSADRLVIDLRSNPGGYLQTSVDVASGWIESGKTVVTEERSDGTRQNYLAEGNNRLKGLKTVVLINGGTASAAEILSGALHDYNIAVLIGEKSFGKGSVQELVDLPEGGAVKVTVAKWITPNGVNLNKDGLNPDIEVKLTEDDIKAQRDPQMDKAIEEVVK